ncbi:MAG: metal-dependent hydrolase [Wenzhouxiangella sp.]|jgi:inner membrane protein|nr:metal-dependent hydrolase [Wenzhouxiangella sp.]
MDPVTQGVVGALVAAPAAKQKELRQAALAGAVGGMAADLDVLIRSSSDTLLYIEYHRQFTHSFAFAPLGALLPALVLWPFLRRRQWFSKVYLWCLLGYLVHPVLDAATSYGTQLWWPFTDQRVAWNWISVIDPLYTLPALVLLIAAVWLRRRGIAAMGLVWMVAYLGFGAYQNHRAEDLLSEWAMQQGIERERMVAKPAFANLVLWRGLVDDGDRFHLVAIRTLPGTKPVFYLGGSVARFVPEELPLSGRRAYDLRRFDHFSSNWLFHYPALDTPSRQFIGDFRYALDPADQRPLWGVLINPNDPSERAEYTTSRSMEAADRRRFFQRLRGEPAAVIE